MTKYIYIYVYCLHEPLITIVLLYIIFVVHIQLRGHIMISDVVNILHGVKWYILLLLGCFSGIKDQVSM